MKICFFNTIKTWGGGENWHLKTAQSLQAKGFDVVIVADQNSVLSQRASDEGLSVKHFSIHNLSFFNPFKRCAIRNYFLREKFDVVIFNSSQELKIVANAAAKAKVERIIYRRGSAIPIKNSFLNRKNFKKLTDIIVNSEATKKTILQNNPNLFPAEKITVIYNGIDVQAFSSAITKPSQNAVPIIGNLGRCVYQKGQDILLQAAEKLKQRGVVCQFVIGGEGPLLADLKLQAKQLGISEMVDFSGFVENSKRFLQAIDIFVLPSRWEGFGYVIAEAMASSKPVVAFDISSNSELIEHEQTGILVPFPDVDLLADAIEKLANDPILRECFGKRGKEIVAEKFCFEQNENKLIEFLS
ncbi:MAG: glycosyltransferase family 4 protein [Bacteroidales bacterium]|jgi:glycosyltransferase involved in cell wall biosynthesis|nr:glycosyltransferase family 4 protein [Bacteroidales bacterium]